MNNESEQAQKEEVIAKYVVLSSYLRGVTAGVLVRCEHGKSTTTK
jgi:hypothetical protein